MLINRPTLFTYLFLDAINTTPDNRFQNPVTEFTQILTRPGIPGVLIIYSDRNGFHNFHHFIAFVQNLTEAQICASLNNQAKANTTH